MESIIVRVIKTIEVEERRVSYDYEVTLPNSKGENCLSPHILCDIAQFAQNITNDDFIPDLEGSKHVR